MRQALFSFVVAALCVQQVVSHPFNKRAIDDADVQVLNYALTLEHLENAFYSGALAKFSDQDFEDAGLPSEARDRFSEVAAHEAAHVAALIAAVATLGGQATQPCTYNFPYNDVRSFADLSQTLEGVGASAYTGAAQDIKSGALLTAAASILATEARHASWVASAVNNAVPWYGSFETPLPPVIVFALAASFITSCPSTNPSLLGIVLGPLLVLTLKNAVAGQNATVCYDSSWGKPKFIVFYYGLTEAFVPIDKGQVAVPADVTGRVYAVGTTSGSEVTNETMVTHPIILTF